MYEYESYCNSVSFGYMYLACGTSRYEYSYWDGNEVRVGDFVTVPTGAIATLAATRINKSVDN